MMQQFVVWDGTVNNDLSHPMGENMILFPNPSTGKVNLNGECNHLSSVRVCDLHGRLLLEKVLPPFSGTTSIDLSPLQPGMLLFEWQSPTGKFVRKVVLE